MPSLLLQCAFTPTDEHDYATAIEDGCTGYVKPGEFIVTAWDENLVHAFCAKREFFKKVSIAIFLISLHASDTPLLRAGHLCIFSQSK